MPQPDWQIAWQARIDAALANPDGTGKAEWQRLVTEAMSAQSEERLAALVRCARSQDAAEAIIHRAERQGLSGPILATARTARREPLAP